MHSSTSSEGPRWVRIAVPCAQTRVAIEMHSRWNERREAVQVSRGLLSRPRPPSLERSETRSVLRHSLLVDSTERGRHHCSGEFEQCY